jgi:hypothetical protein
MRLDQENADFVKAVVEKMGYSLGSFLDQVFAGWVAVFKNADLHKKDMTEWTANDMAKFYKAFQYAQPKQEDKKNEV